MRFEATSTEAALAAIANAVTRRLYRKNVPQGMVWIVEASSNTIGPTSKDLETQAGIKFGTWVGTMKIKNIPIGELKR